MKEDMSIHYLQWETKIHTGYFKNFFYSVAHICCLEVCITVKSLMSVSVSDQNWNES